MWLNLGSLEQFKKEIKLGTYWFLLSEKYLTLPQPEGIFLNPKSCLAKAQFTHEIRLRN